MSTLIITGGRTDDNAAGYLAARAGALPQTGPKAAGRCCRAPGFEHVIAVDGGLLSAERLGLKPDYIVGDFDTLPAEYLRRYEQQDAITVRRFRPEKDDTDTQIAVELAQELEGENGEVLILGGLGTRFDHTLANVFLLEKLEAAGIRAALVDSNNRISVHRRSFTLRKSEQYGSFVSFLALTPQVTGITLTGFKYPLTKRTLRQEDSLCISNELAAETGTVEFEEGLLLMAEARD